jgi:hypothetical protein
MIRPEHQFYIRPDLRKAASIKAESTTAESVIRPKKLVRHFLMHWMSVKLPDNFQMREHSWPCRFHIKCNLCVYCK